MYEINATNVAMITERQNHCFLSNVATMMRTMHAETASTTEITGTAEIAINSWEGWIERNRAELVVDGCLRCLRRPGCLS